MGREHASNLAAASGVDLVAVVDVVEQAASALALEVGADPSTDALAMLDAMDLDGLVVASSDASHAELACAAIDRAIPVLVEKPLAHTLYAARSVVDAEVSAGCRFAQVGFMREYDPAHRQLVEAVAEIGPVRHVRCVHRNANEQAQPRTVDEVLVQSVIHDIHTARFLTGAEVTGVSASTVQRHGGVGFLHLVLAMSDGSLATIDFDDTAFGYEVTVEVDAARGMAVTSGPVRAEISQGGTRERRLGSDWFGWFSEAYRLQIHAWLGSLRSGELVGPSAWDGFVAQLVVEAASRSAEGSSALKVDAPERPELYA